MSPHDISEILLSAEKFRELYDAIQECYQAIDECLVRVRRLDTILGTSIKDNAQMKKLQTIQLNDFERGFGK